MNKEFKESKYPVGSHAYKNFHKNNEMKHRNKASMFRAAAKMHENSAKQHAAAFKRKK